MTGNRVLVTGGAGFIGSAFVRHAISNLGWDTTVIDSLTYSGHLANLAEVQGSKLFKFIERDVRDQREVADLLGAVKPSAIAHFAAESHVDRSVDAPREVVSTNVMGTQSMLEAATQYWRGLSGREREGFRFLHVSTDEVFGSLGNSGRFTETSPYDPRSPYSASKAGADHLVRAWHHTFELPVLITNCSNNYGPHQFPEKLIPVLILSGLNGSPLPIYGSGENVRDWIYVDDHVEALCSALQLGTVGSTYLIGASNERSNLEVAEHVCNALDALLPDSTNRPHKNLISLVEDRPGHDFRYAIDSSVAKKEIQWEPKHSFEEGLNKTVRWYFDNKVWCDTVTKGRSLSRQGLGKS